MEIKIIIFYKYMDRYFIPLLPLLSGMISKYFGLTKFSKNEIKAPSQPPGYIFGIVWTTLYILLYISTFIAYDNKIIVKQFLIEVLLQVLWLFGFGLYNNKRYKIQYYLSSLILIIILCYGILVRIPTLYKYGYYISLILYIPFVLWIIIANLLGFELLYLFSKK